ncbi:MAG TPA: SDR family NAD(P)-dependent oxidoreductase [Anaeromyxobacteraceae bacterium]|nr:SDR family NAD(P)-dependent oxidoreductase [Anaeromyxobacteraceae bacterium]
MRFTDKTVLVAGGTGALGRAVCLALLADGARVMAVSRRAAEFEGLAAAAGPSRDRLAFLEADVADPAGAARAVAGGAASGALAAVVNAAGAWAGGRALAEEDPDVLARMLAANLAPSHALARAAVPALSRAGGGAIVSVASLGAVGPQPGQASYGASKAAALSLLLSLAEEVRSLRIRVNVVLPGTMDTEANRRAMPGADRSAWVRTEDVARVIAFLCSDEAKAISGAAIPVRGGT